MDAPGGRANVPGPTHQDPTKETQTTLLPDPGSPAGGKCSPHGPQLQSRSGWPGRGRGGGGAATGSQGLEGSGAGRRQLRDLKQHCDIMKSAHLSAQCCLLCRRDLIESPTCEVDNVPPFPSQ